MKKLTILAAIVCVAGFANAAAIDWSTGNLVDHSGTILNKSTAYTATVYFYSDNLGTVDVSSSFGATLSESTSTKRGEYSNTISAPTAATGTYYTKVIIQNSEWSLESDLVSFAWDADKISASSINYQTGNGLGAIALNNSGTNYGWQSVPEPTSGLLLLLGMAGLALRRRRA